jgi:N-acetylglucosamine-6-phosphate deacetylase
MNDVVVRGGEVVTPAGRAAADVVVRAGRIAEIVPRPERADRPDRPGRPGAAEGAGGLPVLDATGLVVAPGLIDLQCNGAGGFDLTAEPERMWDMAALLPQWGVTAWLPTVVTSPDEVRQRAIAALRAGPSHDRLVATPLGLHFEGPYLAPERRGAHAPAHLRPPDRDAVAGWSSEAGVALVTLAPELPGALDVLRDLVGRGVVVSLGHSSASAAEATAAVDAGARWVTHLFNAMASLHHRDPGLVGVALTDERLSVGAIVDGLHVHPMVVAVAARSLGSRLTLVTDAVTALGMPPGRWALGDVEALADGEGVRLADGTLAGSLLSLDRAVANLVAFTGAGLDRALDAASGAPARLLGLGAERGVIAPGAVGDLVLLLDAPATPASTTDDGVVADGVAAEAVAGRDPGAGLAVVATVIGGVVAHDRRVVREG